MEVDPTRMCELLVGLPDVNVLAVDDHRADAVFVHVEARLVRPGCAACGAPAWVKERPEVEVVDLPCFGRPSRLVWHKVRWCCPDPDCETTSWTAEDPRIAPARGAMTDRAGRWVTVQVGRRGRTVAEVARELGCDWHTVNDAVMAYGSEVARPVSDVSLHPLGDGIRESELCGSWYLPSLKLWLAWSAPPCRTRLCTSSTPNAGMCRRERWGSCTSVVPASPVVIWASPR